MAGFLGMAAGAMGKMGAAKGKEGGGLTGEAAGGMIKKFGGSGSASSKQHRAAGRKMEENMRGHANMQGLLNEFQGGMAQGKQLQKPQIAQNQLSGQQMNYLRGLLF